VGPFGASGIACDAGTPTKFAETPLVGTPPFPDEAGVGDGEPLKRTKAATAAAIMTRMATIIRMMFFMRDGL
jgi:hypothetical protein